MPNREDRSPGLPGTSGRRTVVTWVRSHPYLVCFAVVCLGLACALPYVLSVMDHQQTDLLIAALLIGGCLALQRARALSAATLFGLAAGMKCTPLLWAPYLAWRGRWKAAAWLVAVAV